MNVLCMTTKNKNALNQIYNTACGEQTTLLGLVSILKKYMSNYDPKIASIKLKFGPIRSGDVPHSLASIEKAALNLKYTCDYSFEKGISDAIDWYWNNL